MQASMSEFVHFLEGRDDGVHQLTENEELMEPRSPSGREDSRALSKQLEDSNKLPPPSYIDELVFGFLGISEAEQNTAASGLCRPRDVVPSNRSAFKASEPKTYAIDGSNESYGGNWDEGLLENDYDYPCLSSYAHEVVITTETQSSSTADKETADRLVANANDYSLDVLAQEKLDVQGFQVEEALHMASAPNVMCKSVIDTLQEDSTFFEDMGFDMRNSSELKDCKSYYESSTSEMNGEGSPEDVSPACSNLHIVPMSDGMMDEVTASPPEEFAAPLSRNNGIEVCQVSSPDVAKVPICTGARQHSPMSPPTLQAVASTSQRPAFDLSSCCGPFGAVVKNQIVLPYSGDAILSENDSLDSQDYGMPKLVRADDPPPPVTDQIYDTPPELDPVDQPSTTTVKNGVKTSTSTLASAAGEDLLKSSKKITLDVVPEIIQEATSQEELNDSLGKIVPSFTPDISNQMPAYMNDIYDVRNISLESSCSTTTSNAGGGGSLPLLPVTEEPKVYKTFKKVSPITPTKKTKAPDVKSKDSCGVDKGFVRDLLRSVSGGPNSLSGPSCVVEFTSKALVKPSIGKDLVAELSNPHVTHLDSTQSGSVLGTLLFSTPMSTSTKNVQTASVRPNNTQTAVEASSLKVDFKSLPDLSTLLDISGVRFMDKVPSNHHTEDTSYVKPSSVKRVSSSEHLSLPRGNAVTDLPNKPHNVIEDVKKANITCSTSSELTSSTSPKKTTTIIANVAQDVVNGVRVTVPQAVDGIETNAQIQIQEKPVSSTSVKAIYKKMMSPQELKVSLPISSLDLFAVKPIKMIETSKRMEVGCMGNANVILGVSTPTMAQRKQYAVPCSEAGSKPSLTVRPTIQRKNCQHIAETSSKGSITIPSEITSSIVEVSGLLLPSKTLDKLSKPKVLSKEVMGPLDGLTVCNQVVKNTMNTPSSKKNRDIQLQKSLRSLNDLRAQEDLKSVEDEASKNKVKSYMTTMSVPVSSDTIKKPSPSLVAPEVSDEFYVTNENICVLSESAKVIKGLVDEMNLTSGKDCPCLLNVSRKHPGTMSISSTVITEFDALKSSGVVENLPSLPSGTKNNSIDANNLPNKVADISNPPVCFVPAVQKIDEKVRQHEGVSSKHQTGLLRIDEPEQTYGLKVHPVIDLVNSLIQNSSKLPDLLEEPPKQHESITAVAAPVAIEHTLPSDDVAVAEKLSSPKDMVEKPKPNSRDSVTSQKVRTSLGLVQKRIPASSLTAETPKAVEFLRGSTEKRKNPLPDTEKIMASTPHSSGGKSVNVLKELIIEHKPTSAQFVVEETETKSQFLAQKRNSVARDLDDGPIKSEIGIEKTEVPSSESVNKQKTRQLKPSSSHKKIEKQKLVTPSVVETQKTRASQDSTEKSVAPTLSHVTEQNNKVQDVVQKKKVLLDVVEKLKTAVSKASVEKPNVSLTTEVSNVLNPVIPNDTIDNKKVPSSQVSLSEGVSGQPKTVPSHGVVLKPNTALTTVVVDKPNTAISKVTTDKNKTISLETEAEKPIEKIQYTAEKESTKATRGMEKNKGDRSVQFSERKPVVDLMKTAPLEVDAELTKTTKPKEVAKKHGTQVDHAIEKESTKTAQKFAEKKKGATSKVQIGERKPGVDQPKAASLNVHVGKMKTTKPRDSTKKHKGNVEDSVEKETTKTPQEMEKKKGALSKVHVAEIKLTVDQPRAASLKVDVDNIKTTNPLDVTKEHKEKVEDTVEKHSTKTPQEMEKKKVTLSKVQIGERKPAIYQPRAASLKVDVDNTITTKPLDVTKEPKEKVEDTVEKQSTKTPQEMEKKKVTLSKVQIGERKPTIDQPRAASLKVDVDNTITTKPLDVTKEPKEKVEDAVEKQSTKTPQEMEKKKVTLSKVQIGERKPAIDQPRAASLKVDVDNTITTKPLDVTREHKEKAEDTVEKESTTTPQEMEKKKVTVSKVHIGERKSTMDQPRTASLKVDVVNTKTTKPLDLTQEHKEKAQDTVEKESTKTLQEMEKKKVTVSKVQVGERKAMVDRPRAASLKVDVDTTITTKPLDVTKEHKEKRENTVEKESTRTPQEMETKKVTLSKVQIGEREPTVDQPRAASLKVGVDNTKTTKPLDVTKEHTEKEKAEDTVEKESTKTPQERKPTVDQPKAALLKVDMEKTKTTKPLDVAKNHKEKVEDTFEKEVTKTPQGVVEEKKGPLSKEVVVERIPMIDKSKTILTKAVDDKPQTTTPQGMAEKSIEKIRGMVEKENTHTSQEVVVKKKGSYYKEVVVEKPVVDRSKTVYSKVVIDSTKSITSEGVDNPEEKVKYTVEKGKCQVFSPPQEVVEKKKGSLPNEVFVDQKSVEGKLKTVSSKVEIDNVKMATVQDGVETPKEKVVNTVEKEKIQTSLETLEKKKCLRSKEVIVERKPAVKGVAEKPKAKGLDTVEMESTETLQEVPEKDKSDLTDKVVAGIQPSPSKKIVEKSKSTSKDLDQLRKTVSSEDLAMKPKSGNVIDKQKMSSQAVNEKNIARLKKSKSSDILAGVVNTRTTKMVHTARKLSLEYLAPKRDVVDKIDKAKKPALGHWRIVKQGKETSSVKSRSVSPSKINERAQEKSKSQLRKRSETSSDRKSSAETRLVSAVGVVKPVESSDKLPVKQCKPAVAVDSKARPSKVGSTKEERKIRLRTRSETSNERKSKDDRGSSPVGSDDQVSSLLKHVVVTGKNTAKQTKEISTDTKQVESCNTTLVKQSKKASSVDLKSLAQPDVPETVLEDNKLRLRTRSETSVDKKVQDNKNSSNHTIKEPTGNSDGLSKPQNDDAPTVSKETNNSDEKPSSGVAVSNPSQEETKTRLRTRSETTNEMKLLDNSNCQSIVNEKQVNCESLSKMANTVDKHSLKHAKDVTNVDLISPTGLSRSDSVQEGTNHHLRTRSETSSEKKLKKDDASSRQVKQPLKATETVPKPVDAMDKVSVNDVYDFIDDDAQSNIHTIDQFRNLTGKSVKNKRSPLPVSGVLESSVIAIEGENKLSSSTRKPRSENTKVLGSRNSRKLSPKKITSKKDSIVIEKVIGGNICDENKSSNSPERINKVRKEDSSLPSSENHSGSKEGAATRSRSRDFVNDEGSGSPTRVLRSKVKQTAPNPATISMANHSVEVNDVDSKQDGSPSTEITSAQKMKATGKAVPSKSELGSGKCDSTTMDTTSSKHQSALTKNNVQNLGLEDMENSLNRRKTRSSIKPSPKIIENTAQESSHSPKDNLLLPKLRSSVSRKLNGSPVTLTNEGGSIDSIKQQKYVTSVDQRGDPVPYKDLLEDDDSLSDTMSLKSEKVGDELKLIIKRVKKPVQGSADCSIAPDGDIVQRAVRETSLADVISKGLMKPVKTVVADVASDLSQSQSTMLSSQDNTVWNAEAVSLKTPPMGSIVTPEPDNIQAVDDMSQHREPEGAKSSTRTAQLRSLVLLEGVNRDEKHHVGFKRDKERGEKKRLARERSILDKKPNVSQSLEDLNNKPKNSIGDFSSTVKQTPYHDRNIQDSSRNSSPSKAPKSSVLDSSNLKNPLVTDETTNENEDSLSKRITRSSLTIASDGIQVKASKKVDSENDLSKPRRNSNCTITGSTVIKRNKDITEPPGLKSMKFSKEAQKQTGKRLQGQFENTENNQDEVPVKLKLRKMEASVIVNSIETESKLDSPNIITASIKSKRSRNPDDKASSPEDVLGRSSLEPNNLEANDKIPEPSDDEVSLNKEKSIKAISPDVPKTSTAQDPALVFDRDVPSKTYPIEESCPVKTMTPDESPTKQQKSEKNSSSRRKSKSIPPIKRVPSDIVTGLIEIGRKTSVKDVCLASESLDKILREEDIKEVPSSLDVLAQSPGKSPDSTTQSRADIVISKLAQEPLTVNNQKISEDSQGVTSTTEIETVPIIVNTTQPLKRETEIHDVGQGKKEDEGVSSTTVDSKLCSVVYSDTQFVEIKKKNVVRVCHSSRRPTDEPSAARDNHSMKESIDKSLLSNETVPESGTVNCEVQAVSSKTQSSSNSSVSDAGDVSPEYDVMHPRRKIWRVNPDLNKLSADNNAGKVPCSSRENEASVVKSLSDEELKRTPLKKRQVWGIHVDKSVLSVKHIDEGARKEDKKVLDNAEGIQSPTSSVDQLRHSIYNILSVGPPEKNNLTIRKADSRSVSKKGASTEKKTMINNKCSKSSKKIMGKCSKNSVTMKRGSCKWRRGLRKSSRLIVSFSQRTGKTKLRKPTKKLKKVNKPLRAKTSGNKEPVASRDHPQIVVVKTLEPSAKYEDLEILKSLSSNNTQQVVEAVAVQPKLVQNDLVKLPISNSLPNPRCNDTKPSANIHITHNFKELTVDPCEDEEASPQYSPLRPRDQDPIIQEPPLQVHSNFSSSFIPITPEWSKQSGLIIPPASATGELIDASTSFAVSPQDTPVPRPIMERSRSFSSLGKTSKPRVRRESHPALPPAVQSSTPVDLSFRRRKSRSDGSSPHLGVNSERLMIPTNMGKLDLNGQNPTFYTSFPGDIVTYDLTENQVVCLKPTSTTCINRPLDPIPPLSVSMSDQLNVPTTKSSIPIRPIPIPNHKIRPAAVGTYPPLSGNRVKIDNFIPAAKSSYDDYSRYLYQQPLSAFHAMKNSNTSNRNPIGNQHKKADFNPLLFTHGTHFMLTPADISNMSSLCPSANTPTLTPSSRRNKGSRSSRAKPDASSLASKVSFTNTSSHEEPGRSTDIKVNEAIGQRPLINQPEAGLSHYSGDSYTLGCVNNSKTLVHPSSLNTTGVLPVVIERIYKGEKSRKNHSLLGRNQEALQKVVREFNEGMNSIKDSNAVPNTKERSKSNEASSKKGSATLSVKNVNFPESSGTNVSVTEDVTAAFNIGPANLIINNSVEITDGQLCTGSKILNLGHCKSTPDRPEQTNVTEPPEQTTITEVLRNQHSKSDSMPIDTVEVAKVKCKSVITPANVPSSDKSQEECDVIADIMESSKTPEISEEVAKHMVDNVPSGSENENCSVTLLDKKHIISCDNNVPKVQKIDEGSFNAPTESCISSDPVKDNVSLPTTQSKNFDDQFAGFKPHESDKDMAVGEQKILVTGIESSLDVLPLSITVVPEQLKSVPQQAETIFRNQTVNAHAVDIDHITETLIVSNEIEHETQPPAKEEPAVLLPGTPENIQSEKMEIIIINDNNKETDVHITESTETKIGESIHCEQQNQLLPKPETPTKSNIEFPTENHELSSKSTDKICLDGNPMEPIGTKIVQPATSSSLTSIEQDLRRPTEQPSPEKADACTDHLLSSEAPCDSVDDGKLGCNVNQTDLIFLPFSAELQPQTTEKQADSDRVNTSGNLKDGESGVPSNPFHSSESEKSVINVSDRIREPADDNSVALDSTSRDVCNDSSANLDSVTDLNQPNPIELTELCSKVDIPNESHQSQEAVSNVSEALENPITSLTPQNSPDVPELFPDTADADLNSSNVTSDPEDSPPSLESPLPSSSDPCVDELSAPTEISVQSLTNKSVILVTAPVPDLNESPLNISMGSSMSKLKVEDSIREVEGANDGEATDVGSSEVGISYRYGRKRKLSLDSEDEEDLQSNKSFDSTTYLIEKCKEVQAKVRIRPMSPTTVDQVVGSGIKINPSELKDIVKCWQEYCRSSESLSQNLTVGRAESDEFTIKTTGREVKVREEPRGPTGQSCRLEDLVSRPSTSREFRTESSSTFNKSSLLISKKEPKNVTAYLLEREMYKNEFIKRGQKRTCVRESFARGIKIYHRESDVQIHNRMVDAVASSSRRSSTIADAMSSITPARPAIHRSYSWILDYLRERRKTIQSLESVNVQSCKDFVNGVSKDPVPGCQTTPGDSLAVATHSRLSGIEVPRPVTYLSPTSLGAITTVISSDSEDSNPGGTEHVLKERDEVRKRIRRKMGSFVYPSCSCPAPSPNLNSNVCTTCRKERNHAQGASSPVRSSSTSLYTKVSNMQLREPEKVMKCAAAVGGGEEIVIVPDSDPVHLLKALMSLAGRRPPSSDTPDPTYAPPCSLSCDDPVPSSHPDAFSLPYEKELLSPRVTVTRDPPLHDTSPNPVPETARESSTRCLQEKPAYQAAPCLYEGNDANLQDCERGIASRSQTLSLHTTAVGSSISRLAHPTSEMDEQRSVVECAAGSDPMLLDSPSTSFNDSRVPPTQPMSAADSSPSTSNPSEEADRLLSEIVGKLPPDVLVDIQRLISGEPPSKKRKE